METHDKPLKKSKMTKRKKTEFPTNVFHSLMEYISKIIISMLIILGSKHCQLVLKSSLGRNMRWPGASVMLMT